MFVLLMLAVALARQYPPGTEPARQYTGTTEKTGRAQDGRPESCRPYPSGQELATHKNADLANAKEK